MHFLWKTFCVVACVHAIHGGEVCQMRASMTHSRYSFTCRYIFFIKVEAQPKHGSLGQAPCPSGGSR